MYSANGKYSNTSKVIENFSISNDIIGVGSVPNENIHPIEKVVADSGLTQMKRWKMNPRMRKCVSQATIISQIKNGYMKIS